VLSYPRFPGGAVSNPDRAGAAAAARGQLLGLLGLLLRAAGLLPGLLLPGLLSAAARTTGRDASGTG